VDVRQPEEYGHAHIPGARLLPLPQLARSLDQFPKDKELVFYCHSGGRSMAAAAMTEEEGFKAAIYNLTGGMLAWDGARLADFPQVALFAGQGGAQMFQTAINLEKGAKIFYDTIGREHADQPWTRTFERLAQAEVAHAKAVYHYWKQLDENIKPFEALFDQLPGEVLEGGLSLKHALEMLAGIKKDLCLRLMEMALQIEYAAFDLYRTLADQAKDEESRQAFTQLSQAEKGHMQVLIDAIGECKG
jgi:rhodanese-related sulfurtransferase/rubrerythrin